jgi:isopenicillin N synthase-like dioxygenase
VNAKKDFFPLVNLDENCDQVVPALRESGFLMVKSSLLPLELQRNALSASDRILESSTKTLSHPSDPKKYMMLGFDDLEVDSPNLVEDFCIIREYYETLRKIRDILLHSIASGLGMSDSQFFSQLHNENNDSLRLLTYFPGDEKTANRCKEHSDYGTLTLLLIDGVGGLEAFVDGQWRQVPYVEGAIVVNIGSILSEWTREDLKATLHRVAGPASVGSMTSKDTLLKAVKKQRKSIAYFADPNPNVVTTLSNSNDFLKGNEAMTIDEYILWRSGGKTADRTGVAFTSTEEERIG